MRIPFARIDAFADGPFTGNPAAVMPLGGWLDDALLQRIAHENDLSETAFLVPHAGDDADFDLRWFTPAIEVALCGHATLASGHMVLASMPAMPQVRFATRQAGVLEVARAADGADGYAMRLPAWPAQARLDPARLAAVAAALGARPAEAWARGDSHIVAVYDDPAEVRALAPDFAAVLALAPGVDLMVIATAPGEDTDVISRVFVPGCGIDEDPVTGSAHAVLAPFWARRFGRPTFSAFQASRRGGQVGCRLDGETVVLAGRCRTVVQGEWLLG